MTCQLVLLCYVRKCNLESCHTMLALKAFQKKMGTRLIQTGKQHPQNSVYTIISIVHGRCHNQTGCSLSSDLILSQTSSNPPFSWMHWCFANMKNASTEVQGEMLRAKEKKMSLKNIKKNILPQATGHLGEPVLGDLGKVTRHLTRAMSMLYIILIFRKSAAHTQPLYWADTWGSRDWLHVLLLADFQERHINRY